jgi:hypothetical protein
MNKKLVTIYVDEKLWDRFRRYVLRKQMDKKNVNMSVIVCDLLRDYLDSREA